MFLFKLARRFLGSDITPVNYTVKQISTYRTGKNFLKICNRRILMQTRKSVIKYDCPGAKKFGPKLEYMRIPSSAFPVVANEADELRLHGGFIPPLWTIPWVSGLIAKPRDSVIRPWIWYTENTKSPDRGSVRKAGGRVGKLDAANEGGFFHKLNKSRLQNLKKMLKSGRDEQQDKKSPWKKRS